MEHELWVDAEVVRQPKARRVFLSIVCKLLTQPDKHTIQPSQYIWRIVDLGFENRYSGHQHSRCFLIERGSNVC